MKWDAAVEEGVGTGRMGPKPGRRGLMALGSRKVFIWAVPLLEGSLLGVGHEVGGDDKDGGLLN